MGTKKDYFRLITGKTTEEAYRIPTVQQTLDRQWKQLHSRYSLLSLGTGTDGDFWLSEEERENHLEIIGTTGEGKSKFLEYLIRHDIDQGHGLLLLDPSSGGETAYNVVKYCAKIGHKKVILIDPKHRWQFNKVIGLNPFHYDDSLVDASVANVTDMLRIVFGTKDSSETPVINKVLPAILHALHRKNLTLYETLYFTDFSYFFERQRILDQESRQADFLASICNNPVRFNDVLGSTTRRLEPLFNETLSLMIGMTGLDFTKLVRENYVILVNLSSFRLVAFQA